MKNKMIFITAITAIIFSVTGFAADDVAKSDPKMQEMMKKYQEYATPGAPHKILSEMAGKWKYSSKFWETADGKPQESNGTSTMKMILGGRWLQHEIKGKAMGQPFQGLGLTGYDNVKAKYDTIWLDSMSTGAMHGEGSFDSSTKTLKDSGTFSCPISGDKKQEYRGEWQIIDKNKMVYAMFGTGLDGGKEFKQMEMIFTRSK